MPITEKLAASVNIIFVNGGSLDVTLQDPVEMMPKCLSFWRVDYDVVYRTSIDRRSGSWVSLSGVRVLVFAFKSCAGRV